MEDMFGPYVVTAYKANRKVKDAGLHVFGPFRYESEAQEFADKVTADPNWELSELPVINDPDVFGTGNERQ